MWDGSPVTEHPGLQGNHSGIIMLFFSCEFVYEQSIGIQRWAGLLVSEELGTHQCAKHHPSVHRDIGSEHPFS